MTVGIPEAPAQLTGNGDFLAGGGEMEARMRAFEADA
jgi:hypothetical protein